MKIKFTSYNNSHPIIIINTAKQHELVTKTKERTQIKNGKSYVNSSP